MMTHRYIALDALQHLWNKDQRTARAAYLRYMRGCKYQEIAQELSCSTERARQLSMSGLTKMSKYLNRKYGKSIALAA
jgi:DNA-directed RNA polymerase specialized sigma24 family protein